MKHLPEKSKGFVLSCLLT